MREPTTNLNGGARNITNRTIRAQRRFRRQSIQMTLLDRSATIATGRVRPGAARGKFVASVRCRVWTRLSKVLLSEVLKEQQCENSSAVDSPHA